MKCVAKQRYWNGHDKNVVRRVAVHAVHREPPESAFDLSTGHDHRHDVNAAVHGIRDRQDRLGVRNGFTSRSVTHNITHVSPGPQDGQDFLRFFLSFRPTIYYCC